MFVHLRAHSEYSLLEAACRVKQLAKVAKEYGMPALALTDLGNMFGAIEFYFACLDQGVKPIIGLDCYLAPGNRTEKKQDKDSAPQNLKRLTFLAKDVVGYQTLCRLSTIGYQEGFYWKPRIDDETLEKYHKSLICLSGGYYGDVVQTFLREGAEAAEKRILKLKEIFQSDFYLEIFRAGVPDQDRIEKFLTTASMKLDVPLVATNEIFYIKQDDQIAQEVLVCIGSNRTLSDESRPKLPSSEFYFKNQDQMKRLFVDLPDAIENTVKIAESINIKFKLKDDKGKAIYHLPSYPTTKTLNEEIRNKSLEGLELRFEEAKKRGEIVSDEQKQKYIERLDYELGVIDRMGFNGYFLIVQDFINWAKENEIPVGPGRGSGAGSLVAFSLRITDLDPVPYSLLFERFLNPERISMPDFDIDFCQDRRGEVIRYVTEKYSQDSVSQIITYGKLQTRAALKDVGRVLGLSFQEVDLVTKLIPDKLGIQLKEALEMEPRLREAMDLNPTVATLVDLALRVEGLVRHAGIHAAGVIIADGKLIDYAPLYRGSDGENVVQYDMKHAEKIGLIKFDFLGLKTLTHIQRALDLIAKNHQKRITVNDISLSDPGIYSIMSRGDTAGIFQFEGDGITDAIKKIKPTGFADITAINALYRPGPMAMIPEFAKRKNKEASVEFLFPELKESLEETYGIIVYQEQVMAIASQIAGYSLGEADMLRRAMGKKIKEEMDQHRQRFLKGAMERNFDNKKSEELFDLMYKFADYGFNKSHAAAYCVVAAHTAWLKNYYPVEFFAALLTTELGDTEKVVKYVKDAQKRNIEVLSPHINHSEYHFTAKGNQIYFGLGAIKGVGETAVVSILEARAKKENHTFQDLADFFKSIDLRKVNKKVIESMIKAGAFDGFGYHRAQLMLGYGKLLDQALQFQKDDQIGQSSFFESFKTEEESAAAIVLDPVRPWNQATTLSYEKEVIGFYLSDHPLRGLENIQAKWTTLDLGSLQTEVPADKEESPEALPSDGSLEPVPPSAVAPVALTQPKAPIAKRRVTVGGIISELRDVITKKGTRMAFGRIEDRNGSCEIVFFPDSYAKYEAIIKQEKPMLVGGFLEQAENASKIIADQVALYDDLLKKIKVVKIDLKEFDEREMGIVRKIISERPGSTAVQFQMKIEELGKNVSFEGLSEKLLIQLDHEFITDLQSQLGRADFIEI